MPTFQVGIHREDGYLINIEAPSLEAAEEKALELYESVERPEEVGFKHTHGDTIIC